MSAEIKLCECGCGSRAPISKRPDRPSRFICGHSSRYAKLNFPKEYNDR